VIGRHPEQLCLEQRLGELGAVDDDEGLRGAPGEIVNGTRRMLRAAARFAEDERRYVARCDLLELRKDLSERRVHCGLFFEPAVNRRRRN
jgi:hypothetical protein